MANLTLQIPDAQVPRIQEAFMARFGYDPELGQSEAVFVKERLIAYMKQVVKDHEGQRAVADARLAAEADVDAIDIT
jgi:hypothetical protein